MKHIDVQFKEEQFIVNNFVRMPMEQVAEYRRHFTAFLKENGLCLRCGRKNTPNHK